MSNPNYNQYSEDLAAYQINMKRVGTSQIIATANLSQEVDATAKPQVEQKEFASYPNPDDFIQNITTRYKI